jgi:hypothetical protein
MDPTAGSTIASIGEGAPAVGGSDLALGIIGVFLLLASREPDFRPPRPPRPGKRLSGPVTWASAFADWERGEKTARAD